MKRLILYNLFILSFSSFCQTSTYKPLIEDDKYWDESYIFNPPGITGIDAATRFFIQGDTIVNNINYKTIYVSSFYSINGPPFYPPLAITNTTYRHPILIREDSVLRKIYTLHTNLPSPSEELLYDFNMQIGDSMNIYDRIIHLDSINPYILNNNDTTRIFYYTAPPCIETYFIEGIGGVGGLLSPIQNCFEGESTLSCVSKNNSQLYNNSSVLFTCNITTNIENHQFLLNNIIYPNPVSKILNIATSKKILRILIINSLGEIVKSLNYQKSINVEILPAGIYSIQLIGRNQSEYIKFIKP